MSWHDDINNIKFEIVTGDKKIWRPLLTQNYVKQVEYNGAQYDFIERAGSLFARRLPKGRTYPLEFAFKGPDNVKIANAFEQSARDTRPWIIIHPFYGELTVQPLSLTSNSSGFDSTIIQVQVIETLISVQPKETPVYKDIIDSRIDNVRAVALVALTPLKSELAAKNVQTSLKISENIAARVKTITKLELEYNDYKSWYRKTLNELNNATGLTSEYLTYLQSLVDMPAIVTADIGTRFKLLNNLMVYLVQNISGVASVSYFESLFFNLVGASVISSSCRAVSIKNDGDFQTKQDVEHFITRLKSQYESYLENLYNLESDEFTPDHDLMFALHTLVCDTVSMLYQVMFEAKQERIYYPTSDTNLILLAHRLYGKASEENIQILKSSNVIGLSEILNIKKDRPIKYYI